MKPVVRVEKKYVASDGEVCLLGVDVQLAEDSTQTAEETAEAYFQEFGYRVVESAKAAGRWPLPPDHPNATR